MNVWNRSSCALIIAGLVTLCAADLAGAGSSNSLMDISADGKLLACSNRDSGTVTIVDLDKHEKLREISVGRHPEGVTFLGDSHRLAIAVYDDDTVVFLDGDSGKKTGSVEVFDEPYGVVATSDGARVFVTLDYPGEIVEIDPQTPKVTREFSEGHFLRGLAISGDDKTLYTSEYYTAVLRAVDVETGRTTDVVAGPSSDNLSRQITPHPTRPKLYLAHIRSRITVAHGAGSIFPVVSVIDTRKDADKRRRRLPMDSFAGVRVTANPWETAVSPDGKTFYVVFAGTDDMYVADVIDDDYRELGYRAMLRLGHNPRAVRVAPDGKTFYVYNALDFDVVAYDAKTLRKQYAVSVTKNPLGEELLLGKQLFYSARPPMTSRLWISCASCHPDGQPDGRTWHNPEGLRNTQSLAGMAWTHLIHWSADRDEVQDFEHTIRGPLMQGRGLVRGPISKSLEKANGGRSKALDALAAYSNVHEFTLSPYSKHGLSDAAKRGRKLFFSKATRCASCHSGPFLTDSVSPPSVPAETIVRHDVGTAVDDPGEKMGPAFDTPTLLGVYRTAPYLHHGKAKTLAEVLTTYNHDDRHGKTSQLSKQQISDLVEYLKALPYEDPVPQAKAAGLVKISK
jgi:DNA-binding beta-propeller fold protein YncE/cytochrome c peroxidase